MRTEYNGSVDGSFESLPFGDGYTVASGEDIDPRHFAGLDQDVNDNDHAMYREYSSMAGRWMSPDPYMGSYNLANPQTLNRYAYVMNNPMAFTDPYGLDSSSCSGGTCIVIGTNPSNPATIILSAIADLFSEIGDLFTGFSGPQFHGSIHPRPNDPNNGTQIKCTGVGRGLAGNAGLVGRQGGIPGQTVQLGTAAVIPQQFGVSSGVALAPYASHIYGTIGNAPFSAITDVMGGRSPIPGMNVRKALEQLFPGKLILEIPGAADQGANAAVTIFIPQGLGCPTGTSVAGGS